MSLSRMHHPATSHTLGNGQIASMLYFSNLVIFHGHVKLSEGTCLAQTSGLVWSAWWSCKAPLSEKSQPLAWSHPIRNKSPQFGKNHPDIWNLLRHTWYANIVWKTWFATIVHWADAGDMHSSFHVNACLGKEIPWVHHQQLLKPVAGKNCLTACAHSTNAV